jgi:hypothetical protein
MVDGQTKHSTTLQTQMLKCMYIIHILPLYHMDYLQIINNLDPTKL